MSGGAKKNLFNIAIVLAISIGFIIWQFQGVDISTFFASMLKVNPWWLLAAFAAMFIYWFLEAVVLQTASKPANKDQRFFSSFRITMIGQFFNTITPMATGGQPAQLVMLTKQGMDAGRGSSVLLVKFIIYQAMVVLNFFSYLDFWYSLLNDWRDTIEIPCSTRVWCACDCHCCAYFSRKKPKVHDKISAHFTYTNTFIYEKRKSFQFKKYVR